MEELSRALRNFNKLVGVAMAVHQLVPDQFGWLSAKVRHPMEPQQILTPGPLAGWPWYIEAVELDSYRSDLTVYGGKTANSEGNYRYGHVTGSIAEPLPPGVKHQSRPHDPPIPFIVRMLTIKDGIVTVRTPEKDRPTDQGPVVFEGMDDGNGSWATVTCYDPRSDQLTVRTGNYLTDGLGYWSDDRTVAEDALQLPPAILEARVATMVRTLDSAADILSKVAARDAEQCERNIVIDPPW